MESKAVQLEPVKTPHMSATCYIFMINYEKAAQVIKDGLQSPFHLIHHVIYLNFRRRKVEGQALCCISGHVLCWLILARSKTHTHHHLNNGLHRRL